MFKWIKKLFGIKEYTAVHVSENITPVGQININVKSYEGEEETNPFILAMLNETMSSGQMVIGNIIDDNTLEMSVDGKKKIVKVN